jgi:hypothetical protein
MNTQTDHQRLYQILSDIDDMCYAGQWKEIIELGNSLVNDQTATPSMLLMWVCSGKYTAYHGNLVQEYSDLLTAIDERMAKEIGRERTDGLIKTWIDELAKFKTNKSLEK